MKKLINRSNGLIFLAGLLTCFVILTGLRMILIKNDAVHYHANFALYVNGLRDEFNSPAFYEEVQACSLHDENDIHGKAHLHDQNNHIIHVHAKGMTWGQFFANLGYTLGNSVLKTDNGVFISGQEGKKLSFMLNGESIDAVANRVIGDRDRLLISYGADDQTSLKKQFDSVENDAIAFDQKADPASCAGNTPLTFVSRLKKALGF